MKKSVGTLTFHIADNYGAVLQAYGLAKAIESMDHDAVVIDYRPFVFRFRYSPFRRSFEIVFNIYDKIIQTIDKYSNIKTSSSKRTEYNKISYKPVKDNIFLKLLKSARKILYLPHAIILHNKFNSFRKYQLPRTSTIFYKPSKLADTNKIFDAIVCGSDQIWHIKRQNYDLSFFLDFVNNRNIKKISYAACVGDLDDFGQHCHIIRELLLRFDSIAVRNQSTAKVICNLLGTQPQIVLDPVFLHSFDSITPPRMFNLPYILVYFLSDNPAYGLFVSAIQKHLGLSVISIGHAVSSAKVIRCAGPAQWLSLFKHADFVCTDSFHGTCFSIKNSKEFITLPVGKNVVRVEDLLKRLGLIDRLIKLSHLNDIIGTIDNKIDYQSVWDKLDVLIKHSSEYLIKSLSD